MTAFTPADAEEAEQIVAWAAAEKQPLEIVAGGSKQGWGRPSRAGHRLDMSRISGVIEYDASELVLTAKAATPMADIQEQLDTHRQMLAFEPPDWRALLPGGGAPTLGGTVACNMAGPRRIRAGSARDHFLGFSAINGWGDAWKAGGKVVKNVTGYDMCKLQAGAFGTLSVLTELSVRVLPRPETSATVLLRGLGDEAGIKALADGLNSAGEVSGAAHLPAEVAARAPGVDAGEGAVTAFRFEGPRTSVDYRVGVVERIVGRGERLIAPDSERFWGAVSGVQPLLGAGDSIVWRLCPIPSKSPGLLRRLRASLPEGEAFYDWGGGLVWFSVAAAAAGPDCGAAIVRAAMAEMGGVVTLLRAPESGRSSVDVFEPAAGPLGALTRRVKASFDPHGILNPGRMQEGV